MLKTIIRLRRDNDYNYAKIKDTFIPASGEVCLVDTAKQGLCAVVGDGKKTYGELQYMNQILMKGYYSNNCFYKDKNFEAYYDSLINCIYIDLSSNKMYHYDGDNFQEIMPTANAETAGIMKLYSTLGKHEDGTMTQKAITEELEEKVEIALNIDEELLVFLQN